MGLLQFSPYILLTLHLSLKTKLGLYCVVSLEEWKKVREITFISVLTLQPQNLFSKRPKQLSKWTITEVMQTSFNSNLKIYWLILTSYLFFLQCNLYFQIHTLRKYQTVFWCIECIVQKLGIFRGKN